MILSLEFQNKGDEMSKNIKDYKKFLEEFKQCYEKYEKKLEKLKNSKTSYQPNSSLNRSQSHQPKSLAQAL